MPFKLPLQLANIIVIKRVVLDNTKSLYYEALVFIFQALNCVFCSL